ncbi:WSC domain-containing protein [Cyathus striatus]|nr:WSC domain-containing protein [Cyathus striatus]
MACSGDSTATCGAANRLSVYSGPPPTTTTTTAQPAGPSPTRAFFAGNFFEYQGCFVDPLNPRGLQHQVSVPGGNTPNGCANACKANGYRVMGLEFGGECWCDDFMPFALTVSDGECNMPCSGDPTNACGAGARLQLYGDITNLGGIPASSLCMGDGRDSSSYYSAFQLRGITNQGDILNLGAVELNPGAETEQSYILTFGGGTPCPECNVFNFFVLQNNQLIPLNVDGNPVALRAAVGESQFFAAFSSQPAFDGYCSGFLGTNNLPFYGFPVLDQIDDTTNNWGLCLNNTANGRRDAVYAPVQNHPHYDFFTDCIFVNLQLVG